MGRVDMQICIVKSGWKLASQSTMLFHALCHSKAEAILFSISKFSRYFFLHSFIQDQTQNIEKIIRHETITPLWNNDCDVNLIAKSQLKVLVTLLKNYPWHQHGISWCFCFCCCFSSIISPKVNILPVSIISFTKHWPNSLTNRHEAVDMPCAIKYESKVTQKING